MIGDYRALYADWKRLRNIQGNQNKHNCKNSVNNLFNS